MPALLNSRAKRITVYGSATALLSLLVLLRCYYNGRETHRLGIAGATQECGIAAYLVAASRLGVQADLAPLRKALLENPFPGVTFGQLRDAATRDKVPTKLTRLSWEELRNHNGTAVLWTNGGHFVATDPRERCSSEREVVRIYDEGHAAAWWNRRTLETQWHGETLLFFPDARMTTPGPVASFESLYEDSGLVSTRANLEYVFRYVNSGTKPLDIAMQRLGCGCAKGRSDKAHALPGESGIVTVEVDKSEKSRSFRIPVYLSTNIPGQTTIMLWCAGGRLLEKITSADVLYVPDIVRGRTITCPFYVHDPGTRDLVVRSVRVVPGQSTNAHEVHVDVHTRQLGLSDVLGNPRSRFRLTSGDYRVDVGITPSVKSAPGAFLVTLAVDTNCPASLPPPRVVIRGCIAHEVTPQPEVLFFSPAIHERTIELTNTSEHVLALAGPPLLQPDLPSRIIEVARNEPHSWKFTIETGALDAWPDYCESNLTFAFTDGTKISVPVFLRTR